MKKNLLSITALSVLAITSANAQLQINTSGTPNIIDFTGFDGSGFDAAPAAGQLDSDTWSVLGLSDGDLAFGASGIGGDYARGTSAGGTTTGGVYAFDDNGNEFLGVQAGGSDFTPGSFVLRVQNNTGNPIVSFDVSYEIKVFNDQGRSNSFNFSHSGDNVTFTPEASLDYTSTEVADAVPVWVTENRTITLSGLNIANGDFYYFAWDSDDVGGAGSRDEMGVDNIEIIACNEVDAAFSYGSSTYCNLDANPTPTITGGSGGTFSSTSGLDIDVNTGEINLANSTVGNYTVTYTISGICSGSETFDVEITGPLDATISGNNDLCENDDPITLTAVDANGTWTADCGACIDATTGEFDPSVSGDGTFTIDYDISGNCGDNDQVSITVNSNPTADFTFTGESLNGGEVTFTNTSTDASFSSWDFDDTNTSMDENPVHTFASAGNYNVCLTVENASGCTDEYCENITVDTDNVSVKKFNANAVNIYPNPISNGKVTVEVPQQTFDVVVIDVTGKTINASKNVNNNTQIDLTNQSQGIYFVKVTSQNSTFGFKLIKK